MNDQQIQIGIKETFDTLDLVIYFFTSDRDHYTIYNFSSDPPQATLIKIGENLPTDLATLRIPWTLREQFFKAMGEFVSNKGIKTDSDMKREGILEATKYHLEDLRHLLKLKK